MKANRRRLFSYTRGIQLFSNLMRHLSDYNEGIFIHRQLILTTCFSRLVMEIWAPTDAVKSISPRSMVQNIRRVGRQFRNMRQEDAHEYLRQLLDCMHEEILKSRNIKTCDGKIAETTLISRVFGGYLLSELQCSKCKYSSKTYNHFQDLSLEVSGGISSGVSQIVRTLVPYNYSTLSASLLTSFLDSPDLTCLSRLYLP